MNSISFHPLSETAIIIDFGDNISLQQNNHILALSRKLHQHPFPGFIESVPAYTTLTIHYNPLHYRTNSYDQVISYIKAYLLNSNPQAAPDNKIIDIPVCYELEYGPDLEDVASVNNLSPAKVVELHTTSNYHVYFLGFTPGFPFLGGLNDRISAPRKSEPRTSVPAGSVGIAGNQTGIYPVASPGGWQIIGRTPVSLLNVDKQPPTLLQPGDTIRFYSISAEAFIAWEDQSWD
ncbi:5-oxoprolinase subunit PxpB [Radiobacillus sp. PE A8.2]|uniref:5-oxoprolinase subunit PxpB n=1 Tax=Radiobacillus sp. PE A8.2 TaxID=3380349 RepID=UPI00388FD7F7